MTTEQMTEQIAEYFRVIQPATMNKIFLVVLLCSFACSLCSQTIKLDTIYYDKNWKGAANKAFATYFRVFEDKDKSAKTAHFRDYYITGELQGEGLYVSIDRKDDKNSVFDGEITEYYKNGLISEHGTGEVVCGYVNIERISGSMMTVVVDIHGAQYTFPWNIDETNKRTDTNVDDSADRTKEIKFSVRKDRH